MSRFRAQRFEVVTCGFQPSKQKAKQKARRHYLDGAPPAPADPFGVVCPHWAHVRKVNPRDMATDLGDALDTVARRMLRRGIPYGTSLAPGLVVDDGVDRGLSFLAYHASLVQSFETLTKNWANRPLTPNPKGHDPIIGQTNSGGRTRRVSFPNPDGPDVELVIAEARPLSAPPDLDGQIREQLHFLFLPPRRRRVHGEERWGGECDGGCDTTPHEEQGASGCPAPRRDGESAETQ